MKSEYFVKNVYLREIEVRNRRGWSFGRCKGSVKVYMRERGTDRWGGLEQTESWLEAIGERLQLWLFTWFSSRTEEAIRGSHQRFLARDSYKLRSALYHVDRAVIRDF